MPVDFFIAPCIKENGNCKIPGIVCKSATHATRFGISDRNAHNRHPAFLDTEDENIWDIVIENPVGKYVVFKAVDFCVDIFRSENQLIKRCEGFLFFEKKILFIELKNARTGRWLIDSREKFQETILKFRENYPENEYEILEPIVSNKLFFNTHQNEMIQKRILKDSIGMEFHVRKSVIV